MSDCARCGHQLGVGRFCTNCGHPVGAAAPTPAGAPAGAPPWRTDTAERPAVRADTPAPATGPPAGHHRSGTTHSAWPIWVAGAVLAATALLGAWMLAADDDPGRASDPAPTASASASGEPDEEATPDERPGSEEPPAEAGPQDVARSATVEVPATAPPNQDTSGNQVRYEARQMLDGVPATCWRMPGDATGETLVVTLAGPTTLTEVGLVNGYAKTAGDLDWYAGNRRVLAVTWAFDDGTTLAQRFDQSRRLQVVPVPEGVVTSTVRLTLDTVSAPGTGRERRDYTAISEISLAGVPAA